MTRKEKCSTTVPPLRIPKGLKLTIDTVNVSMEKAAIFRSAITKAIEEDGQIAWGGRTFKLVDTETGLPSQLQLLANAKNNSDA